MWLTFLYLYENSSGFHLEVSLILDNSNKYYLVSKVTWIRSSNEKRGAFVRFYADRVKFFL